MYELHLRKILKSFVHSIHYNLNKEKMNYYYHIYLNIMLNFKKAL